MGFNISLCVHENNKAALFYKRLNISASTVVVSQPEEKADLEFGQSIFLSVSERKLYDSVFFNGDILCQWHPKLNNRTRRTDMHTAKYKELVRVSFGKYAHTLLSYLYWPLDASGTYLFFFSMSASFIRPPLSVRSRIRNVREAASHVSHVLIQFRALSLLILVGHHQYVC